MDDNPLIRLRGFGQSVWLDFLSREMIETGELKRRIEEDGLSGLTSNPTIFEAAIDGSDRYDDAIAELARRGCTAAEIYEALVVEDVRRAADLFRACHDVTRGRDGFASLEVSPRLARDTRATVEEAHRLWGALDRPNVFIKVPATREGIPAIRDLTAAGVNVNITLLFGLPRYREVIGAYLDGLEARAGEGASVRRVASVASFFLSRIDVMVDPVLEELARGDRSEAEIARGLIGEAALASARGAYRIFREVFTSPRFRALELRGARPQRVLWASTGTKNPRYSDVKYVEPLIGPDTVNTMPPETLDAYRDHGAPAARLGTEPDRARGVLERLAEIGIHIDEVTQRLEDEGIDKFIRPFDKLMDTLEARRLRALAIGTATPSRGPVAPGK